MDVDMGYGFQGLHDRFDETNKFRCVSFNVMTISIFTYKATVNNKCKISDTSMKQVKMLYCADIHIFMIV